MAKLSEDGIRQPISDELPRSGNVKVRQVAARIPALEALRLFLRRERIMPLAFLGRDLMRGFLSQGVRERGVWGALSTSRDNSSVRADRAVRAPMRTPHSSRVALLLAWLWDFRQLVRTINAAI